MLVMVCKSQKRVIQHQFLVLAGFAERPIKIGLEERSKQAAECAAQCSCTGYLTEFIDHVHRLRHSPGNPVRVMESTASHRILHHFAIVAY